MHLLFSLTLLLGLFANGAAQATVIQLSPLLAISLNALHDPKPGASDFLPVTLGVENLSVVQSNTSTRTKGSGTASARTSGWREGSSDVDMFAGLGDGAGSAEAHLLNISTFDIVFPKPGFYYLDSVIDFATTVRIDTGDSAFGTWNRAYPLDAYTH
jgi:hypothetical protein